ncbi:MAG TPA: hypothetical protein ENG63_03080 [Candidatus Desulfofervidus auxilii]|uniref:Uncharacterized protein n=1 Tax=Desulfofervidus auxilii TaxID=1621989 RepID=A0A7C0Y6I6_DESA2|nr:hypothetical protein [Candidatus Desulfofervidus auxilii]
MCKKAKEIQKRCKYKSDDLFVIQKFRQKIKYHFEIDWVEELVSEIIWLPRQDQLQEMLKPNNYFWNTMAMENVLKEMREAYGILLESPYFDSGEQFWLAYVMWKKYKKIWSDSDKQWIIKKNKNGG